MDIENCKEFIELARCLSFTETANKLNVSQPVLSKHVAAMEQAGISPTARAEELSVEEWIRLANACS